MVDLNELIEQLRSNARPCDILEAADTIESLRTALSQEREAREKAERMLALRVENPGAERYWESRWRDAESSLAEAKRLLKPLAQNPGASSLAKVYAHLTRQHAQDAAHFLSQEPNQ
jgi:hypothetical protein